MDKNTRYILVCPYCGTDLDIFATSSHIAIKAPGSTKLSTVEKPPNPEAGIRRNYILECQGCGMTFKKSPKAFEKEFPECVFPEKGEKGYEAV